MMLIGKTSRGHARSFGDVETYLLLSFIEDNGRVSRRRASEHIGIGEGSVRKIADILVRAGLIEIFQTGMSITDYGKEFMSLLPIRMVDIEPIDSVVGSKQQAVLVKGVSDRITNGMMQRDAGIRAGSLGCTTFVFRDGRMTVPPDWDVDKESPGLSVSIVKASGMTHNDTLIVGGDDHFPDARKAALTAAIELV